MESVHLPWFFCPEVSCWQCQRAECNSFHLAKRHWVLLEEEGKLSEQRQTTWFKSMKAILDLVAKQLRKSPERLEDFVHQTGWLQDLEPTVSISRKVLGEQLSVYWRGTVESVATPSPSDVAALLHWRTMMHLLSELSEEVQKWVRQAPLLSGQTGIMRGSVVIDGHCHLELLHQWVSSKATIESALEALAKCYASSVFGRFGGSSDQLCVPERVDCQDASISWDHPSAPNLGCAPKSCGGCRLELAGEEDGSTRMCGSGGMWVE